MAMNRRDFLKNGALAAVGMGLGNSLLAQAATARAAATTGQKVLVVVNLFGGNDGLSTLVPLAPAEYSKYLQLRPTLFYDPSQLLTLNGEPDFGLNPGMTGFQDLFNQGKLAIINGVSVPQSAVGLFNHSTGQFEFQSCDLTNNIATGPPTGWVGRYLDTVQPGQVRPGIDLGGGRLMMTGLQADPVSIKNVNSFKLQVRGYDKTARTNSYGNIMNIPVTDGGVGEVSRQYRLQALQESQVILAATAAYTPTVAYPTSKLGNSLQECAKLIFADVGARALAVGRSGFDTHSDQNASGGGSLPYHEALLKDVSDSISAFHADMVNMGLSDRVLIMTISEFGRRAYENGDKGTDHGLSSVAFVAGDDVNGGIYGLYPSLNSLVLNGNLAPTTDFRSLYASAVANWLNTDPVPVVGGSFPLIAFV